MPPLLSVLLPTRNRLEFLRQAVETVRRQDDPDWELVISDNDSEEDIGGWYEQDLAADERIRYVRTPSFVPVTENWTNALEQATGRYVLMLGDDDALLPGYVSRLRATVERFEDPDVVYGAAYLFAYPDVMPDFPDGYLMRYGHAQFLRKHAEPYVLTLDTQRDMVRHAMQFRMRYGFNAQFSAVNRRFVEHLGRGPFYQSDFPDFYSTNVAFMAARRVVADPRPGVVIGVTPKSYGFYHAQDKEQEGRAFLGTVDDPGVRDRVEAAMLPGSNINAGWLSAVETIRARWPELIPAEPDHRRFRRLQATHCFEGHYFEGTVSAEELALLEEHLRPWERRLMHLVMRTAKASAGLPRQARWAITTGLHWLFIRQYHVWNPPKIPGHRTMLDVYAAAESDRRMTNV